MKIFPRHVATSAAALMVGVAIVGTLSATPALAQSGFDYCQNFSGIYCLNDLGGGGSGNTVAMYTSNGSYEDFWEEDTGRCGGYVNGDCPFSNSVFDSRYAGYPIVQIEYQPESLCVATNSDSFAVLGTCNNPGSGYGGSNGTLFVDHNGYLINVYWTNQGIYGDNASCMYGEPWDGGSVTLNLETTEGCPIWGLYSP
jgi:hypothetical protein